MSRKPHWQPPPEPELKTKRELRRMSQAELIDYHFLLLNSWSKNEAIINLGLYAQNLMMENQERSRRQIERERLKPKRAPQPGHIYILQSAHGCKIGKTTNLTARLRALNVQLPFPATMLHTIATGDTTKAEAQLHQRFAHCRLNGEWFNLSPDDITWLCSLTSLEPT